MEPKCYQVKVLHYLNPHLIWVEVISSSEDPACRQNLFEQVGVYGILPLDTNINMLEESIDTCKTQEWCRGVVNVMDDLLLEAKCVWFSPMYEDYRTSIFDNNIHKYGKVVVLNAKGNLVDLSKILTKTRFACYDENIFLHELTTFQLKTRLNRYKTAGVLRALEKSYTDDCTDKLNALKACTLIVQAERDLEHQLSDHTRLGSHKILPLTSENIQKTLDRKQMAFQQCKDIDNFSIGRGQATRSKAFEPRSPGFSATDLTTPRPDIQHQHPARLVQDTKKMLLAIAKRNKSTEASSLSRNSESSLAAPVLLLKSHNVADNHSHHGNSQDSSFITTEKPYQPIVAKEINPNEEKITPLNKALQLIKETRMYEEKLSENSSNHDHNLLWVNENSSPERRTTSTQSNSFEEVHEAVQVRKKIGSKKPVKRIIPEYDPRTQTRVAYGPPDTDQDKLVLKVVSRLPKDLSFEEQEANSEQIEEKQIAETEPENGLQGLDSEVGYPVSNKILTPAKANESYRDLPTGHFKIIVESREEKTHWSHPKTHLESKTEETTVSPTTSRPETSFGALNKTPKLVTVDRTGPQSRLSQRDKLNSLLLKKKLSNTCSPLNAYDTQSSPINDTLNSSLHRNQPNVSTSTPIANILKKKMEILKKTQEYDNSSTASDTSPKDMTSTSDEDVKAKSLVKTRHRHQKDSDSDESTLSSIVQRLNLKDNEPSTQDVLTTLKQVSSDKNHVNPFKNLDASVSKFVEKLVSPVLMVHTKQDKRIQPVYEMSEVNFNQAIHKALKDFSVKHPMTLQTITWPSILRGHSIFLVSPAGSGKTLGIVPAVCRLVTDFDKNDIPESVGPIAIIICATVMSVLHVERLCKRFLGHEKVVLSCYAGIDEKELMMSILNGCDIFVCSPSALVRLLNVTDFGLDLRRLTTFVLDDCERLSEVYLNEIKYVLLKIKEMLRNRADKVLTVQYVVASRNWCDFMENLVAKAPNPMICIGSFQECVLYSKTSMSVKFVSKENKTDATMAFMCSIDTSKRTVIVCRTDDEVDTIAQMLRKHKHVVFAGKTSETVEELYNLSKNWMDYNVPLVGPVLVCCDSNLIKLNTTNAHNLLHYSLPNLFSMFSRRFSVLIDHYPSMFKEQNETVKINILLDESNVEQLPKILHFIKRLTKELPVSLDTVSDKVLSEKDAVKAKNLVPICDYTLALGECPDFWNCRERHTLFKDYDEPKHWVPKTGHITFKILHYHTATGYSARLISNIVNGQAIEYAQTYSRLLLNMGMYYTKEANKRPHGDPEVGDICAVAIRENFFERCQVVKVLSRYANTGKPNYVLVNLIDEGKWERTRDVHLYHLPEELKTIDTYVVQVKLAGLQPKDRDITFSELARQQLKRLTDRNENVYMRAHVVMALGNTVLVSDLEACQDLSSLEETVVHYNMKEELLRTHAVLNPDHVKKLYKLCERYGIEVKCQKEKAPVAKVEVKELPKPLWAHLENDDVHLVYFASADNPDKFFVRLEKFEDCLDLLTRDIQKHVTEGKSDAITKVRKDDIVLAKFPDDSKYYRARIDKVLDDDKVKCFFVDHGDWRHVEVKDLREMTANFFTKLPFQAIECRLIGIKPVGNTWSEYSTNWLCDQCYEGRSNDLKELYVKYFTKELAECTGGHKYGIALIDTTTERDIVINNLMAEHNLASENEDEIEFLEELNFKRKEVAKSDSEDEELRADIKETPTTDTNKSLEIVEVKQPSLDQIFLKKPIRSVPLVSSSDVSDDWDVQFSRDELKPIFKQATSNCAPQDAKALVSDISEPANLPKVLEKKQHRVEVDSSVCSSKLSDFEIVPSPKNMVEELDSDDYSTPEVTQSSEVSEADTSAKKYVLRKPKLFWRQKEKYLTLKIILIGVEDYDMQIQPRSVKFKTNLLDTDYSFHLNLYGVVNPKLSTHSSKGQYVYVKLTKLIKKPWKSLTLDSVVQKWIVYDPDDIATSSDENEEIHAKTLKKIIVKNDDSDDDSDFDGLLDDLSFRNKYNRDSD